MGRQVSCLSLNQIEHFRAVVPFFEVTRNAAFLTRVMDPGYR
jgi:hypothetical protein